MNRLAAVMVAVSALAGPGKALAGLEVCNDTTARQTVAIGYKSGDDWVSEGWWNIPPDDCSRVVGGDLKNRYYYILAKARDWTFEHEDYVFCTTAKAFTITGDSDCEQRGYDTARFRRIDTGKTAKHHVLSLSGFVSRAAAAPAPAGTAPGTYGEPFTSGTAIFQSCIDETEATFCTFHSDGTKFFVNDDGRTPADVMSSLRGYLPGTPIELSGDLVAVYDRTADIVLRQVLPRAYGHWDSILNRMQGQWYSVDDPANMFTVLGAERENTYDGAFTSLDYLAMGTGCEDSSGGEYLIATDEESGDTLCYAVEEISDWTMTLMYLPRGNMLEFRKLD